MPFSRELPPIQQQRFSFISQRWSQLNTLEKDWGDKALNFLTLTNAGGAVAVLSFIGVSPDIRAMIWPRVALGCFSLGIICTGILIAKQFHKMSHMYSHWRRDSERYLADNIEWDTLTSRDEDRAEITAWDWFWGYTPFVLFVLGCIFGAVTLIAIQR